MQDSHVISEVLEDSPADVAGIKAGDVLVAINDSKIGDIFDYHYLADDEETKVTVRRGDESLVFFIEKDLGEDLGLVFSSGLLDEYRSCHNKCMFCFIDQMPPGMRETLYFKDDDTRLSFLQGNYVTLTNISDEDLNRIISYRLAPINVSVHSTNPELRCKMLSNRFAGDILEKMQRLADADLPMNGQIVLCKGVNDGEELERSIKDLLGLYPALESLSVVPVGITKFREGLYPLDPFDKEGAKKTLEIIKRWQNVAVREHGIHFVHASDEWYLLAEEDLPEEESYDGYLQLENGVGMLRLLIEEFTEALNDTRKPLFMKRKHVSLAAGKLAAPFIEKLCQMAEEKYPKLSCDVYSIRNDFFGENITVSGLITGQDLIAQLKDVDLGDKLLLPANMFRAGEEVFLDDITLSQVSETLQVPVTIVKSNGSDLLKQLLN